MSGIDEMTAIVYRNTKTTLPSWVNTLHVDHPLGMAYESETHFVHFYGRGSGLFVFSVGLTATEKKEGSLTDWVIRVFGADDIKPVKHPVGSTIRGVWRPALYFQDETLQGLGNSESELRASEQALRLLVERLDDLLLYIEPDTHGLEAYSHKTRELLILACTELENTWKYYMRLAGANPLSGSDFTTKDYVLLLSPLHLAEFEVTVKPYGAIAPLRPFAAWDTAAPTKSLSWYNAYNKTKHDRALHFSEASLQNCLSALAANIVMFCVRFSPFPLLEGPGTLSPLINQLFHIVLHGPNLETLYVPMLKLPENMREDLVCGGTKDFVQPWKVLPLTM